ncbi:MAG: HrpE/YscL family type III secretion apparatus protein [Paraburkholderia sp.]|nr:MAG: HrpE/YscL family type III secretion apparatus protein [Paraburkholderia sp.]
MVIWLRSDRALPDARVGTHADVIPRDAFGALVEIDEGYAQLAEDRDAILTQAREEARAIVDAAHAQAETIVDAAHREYESAAQRGYQAGEKQALADWMDRLADVGDEQRQIQTKLRERLAEIVTLAVEQIVRVQQSETLFERALTTIDRIVEGATYLRVRVSPVDYEKACIAFERLSARWRELGRPFPLSVVADKRLEAGSCICESDFGSIDASLTTQLRAMRSAVARALKHSLRELHNIADAADAATD